MHKVFHINDYLCIYDEGVLYSIKKLNGMRLVSEQVVAMYL